MWGPDKAFEGNKNFAAQKLSHREEENGAKTRIQEVRHGFEGKTRPLPHARVHLPLQ